METTGKLIGRFPTDDLFFIFTSGFFVVFSFPFTLSNLSLQGHQPFINVMYLYNTDFTTQLAKLVLSSLAVWVIMYLLYDS
jgi:hypothetical protein